MGGFSKLFSVPILGLLTCGGLGVEAPIGNNANVSLSFRYNHGQGNMQADTRSIPLYNRSLNFNIGISQGF
jgi:hypothetical protein